MPQTPPVTPGTVVFSDLFVRGDVVGPVAGGGAAGGGAVGGGAAGGGVVGGGGAAGGGVVGGAGGTIVGGAGGPRGGAIGGGVIREMSKRPHRSGGARLHVLHHGRVDVADRDPLRAGAGQYSDRHRRGQRLEPGTAQFPRQHDRAAAAAPWIRLGVPPARRTATRPGAAPRAGGAFSSEGARQRRAARAVVNRHHHGAGERGGHRQLAEHRTAERRGPRHPPPRSP